MKRKSLPLHRAVQEYVASYLPPGEGVLEQSFPGHFADVAWPKQGIVFEIQCSSISVKEVEKRIKDYGSYGYRVIWILHQKEFNKKWLSLSERYLRTHGTSYFTNITAGGQGGIYDQTETLKGLSRIYRSPPFPIDICALSPKRKPPKPKRSLINLYDKALFTLVKTLNG
jgi:competence protein CoiA